MMNVFLSTPTFDLDGAVMIPAKVGESELGEARRRVNRSATLDGGVAINDFGYSDGDRTISLAWRPLSNAFEDNLRRLVEDYPRLTISTREGVFEVAPEFYKRMARESRLQVLVVSKLSS